MDKKKRMNFKNECIKKDPVLVGGETCRTLDRQGQNWWPLLYIMIKFIYYNKANRPSWAPGVWGHFWSWDRPSSGLRSPLIKRRMHKVISTPTKTVLITPAHLSMKWIGIVLKKKKKKGEIFHSDTETLPSMVSSGSSSNGVGLRGRLIAFMPSSWSSETVKSINKW